MQLCHAENTHVSLIIITSQQIAILGDTSSKTATPKRRLHGARCWRKNSVWPQTDIITFSIRKEPKSSLRLILCIVTSKIFLHGFRQKKGDCTTKNIYRHLRAQMQVQLPQQGSRSILPQANHILRRMWKLKEIPPLIKTFTWRLIRRALATRQRAGRYSPNIDKLCTACGSLQTDAHLFFHCDFARAVWFLADPPLCTHCLPEEEDGVQNILSSFISDSTSNSLFQKILIILWYLWKARND